MPTIRYSVIIPHKDIPDLLNRLLRSIPQREDIEIFVVDDNSDPKIMADYQELENVNYRYTHESCGAGYARNIALREAHREWLLFADADDYFLPGAFDLFDCHATDEADIIYFKCDCRYSDTGEIAERKETQLPLLQQFDPSDEHTVNRIRYTLIVPWGKMIRRAMVECHGILFDETRWANDVMFSTRTAYHARSINVDLSQAFYCTTVRRGSLVNQYGRESLKCRYIVAMRQNRYLREHGLFRYQQPVHDYLRKSMLSGAKVFFEFLRLARQYNAGLFSAFCAWLKTSLFLHKQPPQQKEPYITYLKKEDD